MTITQLEAILIKAEVLVMRLMQETELSEYEEFVPIIEDYLYNNGINVGLLNNHIDAGYIYESGMYRYTTDFSGESSNPTNIEDLIEQAEEIAFQILRNDESGCAMVADENGMFSFPVDDEVKEALVKFFVEEEINVADLYPNNSIETILCRGRDRYSKALEPIKVVYNHEEANEIPF